MKPPRSRRAAVVVGEAPGPNGRPGYPLFPYPNRSSGKRLCEMAGFEQAAWLRDVRRVNLVSEYPGPRYPMDLARANAENMCHSLLRDERLILLGTRVARAFGLRPRDYEWGKPVESPLGPTCIVLPHPSGRCLVYNDPAVRRRLGAVLRRELTGD